jgi:molybdopterin converting factor small subunit
MLVKVRSYGLIRKYTSHLSSEGDLEIPEGTKAADVLALLKVLADSRLVLLVNSRPSGPESTIQHLDTFVFFPPMEGG